MCTSDIKIFRKKLKRARDRGNLNEISEACCSLAAYLSEEEEYEEALKLYKESLTCCEKAGNLAGVALANRMISEVCIPLGYFEEALEHATFYLNYAKSQNDKTEEQRALVSKGRIYFTQAECLRDDTREECKKIESLLELSLQNYREGYSLCNSKSLNVSEKERQQMKARVLQNKALVFSRQNKLKLAQSHLIEAIKISSKEKLNDTEYYCYLSLGEVYLKKQDYTSSLNVYDKALQLSHSPVLKRDSLVGKAKTYIAMGDFSNAKSTLKKAHKVNSDEEILTLYRNVSNVIYLENNLCSTPDEKKLIRKDLYAKLGNSYRKLGCFKQAIQCYLNMLNCTEKAKMDKTELIKCYSTLCNIFIQNKQYEKALFYSHQELELLSSFSPSTSLKIYLRIAKLQELNEAPYEDIYISYYRAKTKAQELQNKKIEKKCLRKFIEMGTSFNKPDLVSSSETELKKLQQDEDSARSSSESENSSGSDSEESCDSEAYTEHSDAGTRDVISDSEAENEEYDRPRERCKRTKFKIKRNERGETELHLATISGNYKKVKQLIDKGHPVDVRDAAGWTPLHEASNLGYVDIVNLLLDYGANINDKGGYSCGANTPLHDAATNGRLEVVETLIKRGASTLVLNKASQTPLQCLLAWKKRTPLDADEDAIVDNVIKILKSPLDSDDIKKHLRPVNSCPRKSPELETTVTDVPSTSTGKRNSRENNSSDSDEGTETVKKKFCIEYKEVMESLRFGAKKQSTEKIKKKEMPALIDEDEYVENFIVDDDEEIEFVKSPVLKVKSEQKEPKTNQRSNRASEKTITVKTPNGWVQIPVSNRQTPTAGWLLEQLAELQPAVKHPDNYACVKVENRYLDREDIVYGEPECEITKWKALPLALRYQKLCSYTNSSIKTFNHTVHPQVCERLSEYSSSRTMKLSNLKLSFLNLIPLSKAIMFETFVQCLDLSKNYFGDKGIELILQILNKCIIQELNLSECNVTSTGVYLFSEALNNMNEFSKNGLEVLNLSKNPITDDAISAIETIIDGLPNLRGLNVQNCELETEVTNTNSSGLVILQGKSQN